MKKIFIPVEKPKEEISIDDAKVLEGILVKKYISSKETLLGFVRHNLDKPEPWDIIFINGSESDGMWDTLEEMMKDNECQDYEFYQL